MCVQVERVRLSSQDVHARESSDHKESRHVLRPWKCDAGTVACIQRLRLFECTVSVQSGHG